MNEVSKRAIQNRLIYVERQYDDAVAERNGLVDRLATVKDGITKLFNEAKQLRADLGLPDPNEEVK